VFPYHQSVLHQSTGEYTELPGWSEDISDLRSYDELPANAKSYLSFLEEAVGVPVVLVGVGPGREQIIWTDAARESALASDAIRATA
jgi:adenylosuccinate synthase